MQDRSANIGDGSGRAPAAGDEAIGLAVTRGRSSDVADQVFGFGAPAPEVRAMARTAQLFCVVTDPRLLGAPADTIDPARPTFGNRLWIADWRITADIGAGGDGAGLPSALILKYRGMALRDLATDPREWTQAESFSLGGGADIGTVAARLQAEIAAQQAVAEEIFLPFDTVVADPGWRGFVLLGPLVGADGLPAALGFLAADPALAGLRADYVAAIASPYYIGGEPSPYASLSGRIRHAAPAARGGEGAGPAAPALTLLALDVAFENSAIVAFSARVELPLPGPVPAVLDGIVHGHRDLPAYAFAPPADAAQHLLCARDGEARPLGDWLRDLCAGLWAIGGGQACVPAMAMALQVSWSAAISAGLPPMRLPILLLPALDLGAGGPADLAAEAGASLAAWLAARTYRTGPPGDLVFSATMTAPGPSGTRLLLPELVLPLERVTESAS